MVQPTVIQDISARTSAIEEGRQGSLQLARILGPVAIAPPLDYSGQSPYSTVYNLALLDAHLLPMAGRVIQAVLAAQTMWQMRPDFLYGKRVSMDNVGNHGEHDHQIIDPDDYADTTAYVQAGFAEPNGGYFALVEPVRAGRGSFWVITGFILQNAINANPTTPD